MNVRPSLVQQLRLVLSDLDWHQHLKYLDNANLKAIGKNFQIITPDTIDDERK